MQKLILIYLLGLVLVGCNSDSSESLSVVPNKINGSVDSISYAEKSLSVNSHHLDAENAEVNYDSLTFPFNTITTGMHVKVDVSNGSASKIGLDPVFSGQVISINGDRITVNGVELIFPDLNTSIVAGDWVLVSAQIYADGSWKVESIDEVSSLPFSEIEGTISGLDENAQTFMIGTVTVDYSNAVLDDILAVQNGLWVEVHGQYLDEKLKASKVDAQDSSDLGGTELEGVITWANSEQTVFEINNQIMIMVDSLTLYEDGTQEALKVGRKAKVALKKVGDDLVAIKVDYDDDTGVQGKEFKVEGEATYSNGQVSINNFSFTIYENTQFDDVLTTDTLTGEWVELDGREVNGDFWLKEIKNESKDSEISLEGLVSDNIMWGYSSSDNSLATFNGQWVDIECQRNSVDDLTQCRLDPN